MSLCHKVSIELGSLVSDTNLVAPARDFSFSIFNRFKLFHLQIHRMPSEITSISLHDKNLGWLTEFRFCIPRNMKISSFDVLPIQSFIAALQKLNLAQQNLLICLSMVGWLNGIQRSFQHSLGNFALLTYLYLSSYVLMTVFNINMNSQVFPRFFFQLFYSRGCFMGQTYWSMSSSVLLLPHHYFINHWTVYMIQYDMMMRDIRALNSWHEPA